MNAFGQMFFSIFYCVQKGESIMNTSISTLFEDDRYLQKLQIHI